MKPITSLKNYLFSSLWQANWHLKSVSVVKCQTIVPWHDCAIFQQKYGLLCINKYQSLVWNYKNVTTNQQVQLMHIKSLQCEKNEKKNVTLKSH